MEEFKGTKGPWFVRFCDDNHSMNMTTVGTTQYDGHNWFEGEPDTVCIVFHQLKPNVSCEMEDFGDSNAQLISAAPDLLEALQNALSTLKAFIGTGDRDWIQVQEGEKAIKKALGR